MLTPTQHITPWCGIHFLLWLQPVSAPWHFSCLLTLLTCHLARVDPTEILDESSNGLGDNTSSSFQMTQQNHLMTSSYIINQPGLLSRRESGRTSKHSSKWAWGNKDIFSIHQHKATGFVAVLGVSCNPMERPYWWILAKHNSSAHSHFPALTQVWSQLTTNAWVLLQGAIFVSVSKTGLEHHTP